MHRTSPRADPRGPRVVDDGERADVVEQRVDREVAPERILFRRAERVVAVDAADRRFGAPVSAPRPLHRSPGLLGGGQLLGRHLPAERRDLDGLRAETHVGETEAPADDPAVPEQPLDLVRMRRGADVEVLRPPAEQQVADAAADEIGDVICSDGAGRGP